MPCLYRSGAWPNRLGSSELVRICVGETRSVTRCDPCTGNEPLPAPWGCSAASPLDVVRMRTPDLKRALKDLLTTRRIDVVQIEYGAMAGYLPVIRRASPETKVVVDELEVTSIAIDRRLKSESQPRPPHMWWQANCWRRFERKTWKASDAVLAMSESERAYIAQVAGPGKARIVPNGVDIDFFRFRSADPTVTPGHLVCCSLGIFTIGRTLKASRFFSGRRGQG